MLQYGQPQLSNYGRLKEEEKSFQSKLCPCSFSILISVLTIPFTCVGGKEEESGSELIFSMHSLNKNMFIGSDILERRLSHPAKRMRRLHGRFKLIFVDIWFLSEKLLQTCKSNEWMQCSKERLPQNSSHVRNFYKLLMNNTL